MGTTSTRTRGHQWSEWITALHPIVSLGAPPDHGDASARAEARRQQRAALAHRGGWDEIPRRHLRFERFGVVVDERDETPYDLHCGLVGQDTKAVVVYFMREDVEFLERANR